MSSTSNLPDRDWWRKRRLVYNAGLVVAGMSAMTLLAAVLEFSGCRAPDVQSAPLKLVYLALAYGAAMGLANLVYSLAPLLESKVRPEVAPRFRRWTFGIGFGVSCALPFVMPILFLARCT